MQIFWDLENCPLNPHKARGQANAEKAVTLTPHQHYDLLLYILGNECGVRMQDLHLHVGIAQVDNHLYPAMVCGLCYEPYIQLEQLMNNQNIILLTILG